MQGKHKLTEYLETRQYLRPFFVLCKDKAVDPEILDFITNIFINIQNREYIKANEVYLSLSIGNKPWPLGVSNVSIHERVSRARIATSAHIMNSEETRKYIIAIKRLLTFAQNHFPTDPAKMFLTK